MTNEELCLRYQAGDTDAAEELIYNNMGFIRSIALRYAQDIRSARMDADDYTQEGATALLRAASCFDPARHVQFLAYAGQVVRNAMIDAIRADNPNIEFASSPEPGLPDDKDTESDRYTGRMKRQLPNGYEANPEHIYIQKEKLEELHTAIHELSPRHHAWVTCRYGFDDDVYKPLTEMIRIFHLSENRAKKTEDEAIGKLKTGLKSA